MSKFVIRPELEQAPESAEEVFRTLKPVGGVRHLWAHQADLIRSYHELKGATDVALELPTGAGKTLVGLLLAEFRRRANHERVVYACPTVHLAGQVGERAAQYGLEAVVLTGPQASYPPADFAAYARAQSLAITTYSAIFNTNPRLMDAQTLVLDDAHAGEGPVSSLWTLSAPRGDSLYDGLRDLLAPRLPEAFAERLSDEVVDPILRSQVEVCGPHDLATVTEQLREVFATHATGSRQYAARMLIDALPFCMAYASWREIAIRPYVPPTAWHAPFANARKRIYMSATLGYAGELERAFGVRRIERLPVPRGWEAHGSGRRFFLFPSASLPDSETDQFIAAAIGTAGRALVLAPSWHEIEKFSETALPDGVARKDVDDLEGGDFGKEENSVLLLANRYDGIDLPDEDCRLIVLTGLPSTAHLQERFLWERLGAKRVLSERIRTRLIQGAGRCTRNSQDFAAVIVRGSPLTDFLSRTENIAAMQPELQIEIEFGLDNSEASGTELLSLVDSFLSQDSDWIAAEEVLDLRTSGRQRTSPPSSEQLAAASAFEVECWQAVWQKDFDRAIAAARTAADELEGGAELRPYRCFWLYLAASIALASGLDQKRTLGLVEDAEDAARRIAWRPRLTPGEHTQRELPPGGFRGGSLAAFAQRWGVRGSKFERHVAEVLALLSDSEASHFERGLHGLGEMLGFDSSRPGGTAAPDGAWRDDRYLVVFEAKTEEAATNPVSTSDVRQALTHRDWVRANLGWPTLEHDVSILISWKVHADQAARDIAGTLMHVSPETLADLGSEALAMHRRIRPTARGLSDEELASAYEHALIDARLDTDTIALRLSATPVARMRS